MEDLDRAWEHCKQGKATPNELDQVRGSVYMTSVFARTLQGLYVNPSDKFAYESVLRSEPE